MVLSTRLTYIGHATLLIEMEAVRILTDPVLRNRIGFLHRCRSKVNPMWYRSIDAVLISHMHQDHLDIPSLRLLDKSMQLIVPEGAARYLKERGFKKVNEISVGEEARIDSIKIKAVPALHSGFRLPFGPATRSLGFVVQGRHSIYFAGDTGLFQEMVILGKGLDVALLPVWGWGPILGRNHLDPRRAAEALKLLHPKIAIPIHWGTFCPIGMDLLRPHFLTYPPYAFAHEAAQVAPDVDVRIIAPGDHTELKE